MIYGIEANKAAKRERNADDLSLVEDMDDGQAGDNLGPEGEVGAAGTGTLVRRAIERLEPDQRDVLLLNHYQGLAYAEVAEVLGVPVGTVRSRLFRAKVALRAELRELLSLEGGGA